MLRRILAFATLVEAATGLALMVDPSIVARLLLGAELSGAGTSLGRCFGVALLALGLACWPGRQPLLARAASLRGMLIYNALIALYLGSLGIAGQFGGLLLWPAVGLHAVVALLLIYEVRK